MDTQRGEAKPQRLKPPQVGAFFGTTEVVPFPVVLRGRASRLCIPVVCFPIAPLPVVAFSVVAFPYLDGGFVGCGFGAALFAQFGLEGFGREVGLFSEEFD